MKAARSQQTLSKNDAGSRSHIDNDVVQVEVLLTESEQVFVATKKHAHPSQDTTTSSHSVHAGAGGCKGRQTKIADAVDHRASIAAYDAAMRGSSKRLLSQNKSGQLQIQDTQTQLHTTPTGTDDDEVVLMKPAGEMSLMKPAVGNFGQQSTQPQQQYRTPSEG